MASHLAQSQPRVQRARYSHNPEYEIRRHCSILPMCLLRPAVPAGTAVRAQDSLARAFIRTEPAVLLEPMSSSFA